MSSLIREFQRRRDVAVEIARLAGITTLDRFRTHDLQVEIKADSSPVTAADRLAETLIRDRINSAFPHDAILGEEFGEQAGTSGFRWILDPIDGTKSFIRGVPLYGTLIGVEYDEQSGVGVIYIPGSEECVHAVRGESCHYQIGKSPSTTVRVSQTAQLSHALLCTSDPVTFLKVGRERQLHQLMAGCQLCRTWGDCYGYLLVATGRADVMIDPQMNIWDAAALQPIIEAAGGSFSDFQGRPTIYSGHVVATNGLIHDEVLRITAE